MPSLLTHIINPVKVNSSSDLHIAQPIVFESMRIAQEIALGENVNISLHTTQYEEDSKIIPYFYTQNSNLESSILDVYNFKFPKKLPRIKDILAPLNLNYEAEYYIYSNVDIGLMPHFYLTISSLIAEGYDAIAINRRTISDKYNSVNDLPFIYADFGEYHKGIDCFVFSKKSYQKYLFHDAFIGSGAVGLGFVANMITHARKFVWLEDQHLTFHIGNDRSWQDSKYKEYQIANNKEILKIAKDCILLLKGKDDVKKKVLESIVLQLKTIIAQLEGKKQDVNFKAKDFIRWYSQGNYDEILKERSGSNKLFGFLKI